MKIEKGNRMKRKFPQNEKGQITVMIGMMMMTFILLMAFVINTGMLVNAKINLQNAADLAAYSGASVQARQLTYISFLNYEMRRQWKKLLFRIYVLGNISQDGFPKGGQGPLSYKPSAGSSIDYGIPTTCVMSGPHENLCHMDILPKIEIVKASQLDSISQTLHDQLQSIEQFRQNSCREIGQKNRLLNLFWLYNADPTLSQPTALSPDQLNKLQWMNSLIKGLGIIPKEVILYFRIETLKSYVNQAPMTGVTFERVNQLLTHLDASPYERTISAFKSAYYTLGNFTYEGDQITLDELLPSTGTSANLLQLKKIQTKIDTFALDFSSGANPGAEASSEAKDCNPLIVPIVVNSPVTVGVYKDPSVLTYYAVRLKAKARLLFWPLGEPPTLKAYSLAQPFGSRIGPTEAEAQFSASHVSSSKLADSSSTTGVASPSGALPNLPIFEGDSASRGHGFETKQVAGLLHGQLTSKAGDSISYSALQNAYRYAMAPNPWEKGKYNIINNPKNLGGAKDSFVDLFPFEDSQDGPFASIWAPVFPLDKQANMKAAVSEEVASFFNDQIGGGVGEGGISAVQNTVSSNLLTYIESLPQGKGEDGEGLNVAKLQNPFISPSTSYSLDEGDPTQYKTSWNEVNDGEIVAQGRTGYSVKFVSFGSLFSNKSPASSDGTNAMNTSLSDAEAEQDLSFIKH